MEIQFLLGEKKLKPVEYRIEEEVIQRWLWWKKVYYIASDFGRMGPFDDRTEAEGYLAMARHS